MIDNTVVISTPPHVRGTRSTRGIMGDVCIALIPSVIAAMIFFWKVELLDKDGLVEKVMYAQPLILVLTCVLACVATEFVYFFIAKGGFGNRCKNAGETCKLWWKQFDLTSVVTGLILAMILPVTVHWYEALIGSIFAIAIVKMFFGGTGKNLVNPASAARVFMLLSFGITMTRYAAPMFGSAFDSLSFVQTGATNLGGLLPQGTTDYVAPVSWMSNLDLFIGTGVAGCIGETSALAILIGYVYLCARKVIKWWQPLLFLVVFGFVSVLSIGFLFDSYKFDIELFLPSILSGGAVFAAVFMFTDYVTSPKGVIGQLVYYVFGAVLLAVLRVLTRQEVASYVILIMNILVPLIDKFFIRKPFGYVKEKKQKEGK